MGINDLHLLGCALIIIPPLSVVVSLFLLFKVPAPGSEMVSGTIQETHFAKPEAMGEEKEDMAESGEDHIGHNHLKEDNGYAKKTPERMYKSKEKRYIKVKKGHGGENILRDHGRKTTSD